MENLYQFHTRALCLHLVKGGTDFLSLWLGLGPLSTETDKSAIVIYWLVVSTPLKNISQQLGLFFPLYRKMKNVPNHQPVYKFICVKHLQRSGRASLVTRTGSPEQGVSGVSAQTLRQFLRKPSVLQLYRFYSFDTHKRRPLNSLNYITVDPKQWVDSRSVLRNRNRVKNTRKHYTRTPNSTLFGENAK